MQKCEILALHGFLGTADDWNGVQSKLPQFSWLKPSLFSKDSWPIEEFEDYCENILKYCEDNMAAESKKVFLGYSLGGRLGLHLLQMAPDFFDRFVFVSVNPGFSSQQGSDKEKRLLTDMKWAHQISESQWNKFLDDWNSQDVFKSNTKIEARKPSADQFDLKKLKQALVVWSLSQQEDMRSDLLSHREKITWIVGQNDSKFLEMAKQLKTQKILSDYIEVANCGHRVHLEQDEFLAQTLLAEFDK